VTEWGTIRTGRAPKREFSRWPSRDSGRFDELSGNPAPLVAPEPSRLTGARTPKTAQDVVEQPSHRRSGRRCRTGPRTTQPGGLVGHTACNVGMGRRPRRRPIARRRRMKQLITTCVLVSGLLSAQGSSAQDLERGKAVYDSRCVICHGAQGDGKGLIGIVHRAQTSGPTRRAWCMRSPTCSAARSSCTSHTTSVTTAARSSRFSSAPTPSTRAPI
jgi:hypothetical protein